MSEDVIFPVQEHNAMEAYENKREELKYSPLQRLRGSVAMSFSCSFK